jgi:hypothetical protein
MMREVIFGRHLGSDISNRVRHAHRQSPIIYWSTNQEDRSRNEYGITTVDMIICSGIDASKDCATKHSHPIFE